MPNDNPKTYEEIDELIRKTDLSRFAKGGSKHAAAAASPAAAALPDFAVIWKIVRPILIILSTLELLPKEWRNAIKVFIDFVDALIH